MLLEALPDVIRNAGGNAETQLVTSNMQIVKILTNIVTGSLLSISL